MSLLNGSANKAREVIDFCMANESTSLKAKVFEIISRSGLEPDDPMFMALLLTGQIRVFLEAAPADLNRLLSEWKQESASSLSEISNAISLIKQTQIEQAELIEEKMEAVSNRCVSDIKDAGMGTVGAIADASSETLEQLQQTEKQVENLSAKLIELDAKFDERERRRIEDNNGVVKWANSTMKKQETVNHQVGILLSEVADIKRNKVWLKIADGLYSLPVLIIGILTIMGTTWWATSFKYNRPVHVFGRNLTDWNIDRIVHCQETNNPKCTIWIVPPDSELRTE